MKKIIIALILAALGTSCESSKQDEVLDFFDSLGVKVIFPKDNSCMYEQLNTIYEDAVRPLNTKRIVEVISNKNISKIVLSSVEEIPLYCDQAVLNENTPVGTKTCDPKTYKGFRGELAATSVDYQDGQLDIVINSQERIKNLVLYNFSDLTEQEIFDLERSVTLTHGEEDYISFEMIIEKFKRFDSNIKSRGALPLETRCGQMLTLEDILAHLSL